MRVKGWSPNLPLAMSRSGLWSSKTSAIRPTRRSTSPLRTTVLWQ